MSRQTELTSNEPIQVVVLVLENHQGDILLTQRQTGQHLAGYWEFPGGKIEPNESQINALKRESIEEINYHPQYPRHITSIIHQYTEKSVQLHVYHCNDNHPIVTPNENHPLKWVHKSKLNQIKLPAANISIIKLIN